MTVRPPSQEHRDNIWKSLHMKPGTCPGISVAGPLLPSDQDCMPCDCLHTAESRASHSYTERGSPLMTAGDPHTFLKHLSLVIFLFRIWVLPVSISNGSIHSSCNTFPLRKDTGKLNIVKRRFLTFARKRATYSPMLNQAVKRSVPLTLWFRCEAFIIEKFIPRQFIVNLSPASLPPPSLSLPYLPPLLTFLSSSFSFWVWATFNKAGNYQLESQGGLIALRGFACHPLQSKTISFEIK